MFTYSKTMQATSTLTIYASLSLISNLRTILERRGGKASASSSIIYDGKKHIISHLRFHDVHTSLLSSPFFDLNCFIFS